MALDEFKTDKILIAHANEKITKTFMAKMGDDSGRKLELQITNEGEIVDLTGYRVYLMWSHESGNHKGIEQFTASDATNGLFELEYPATMLNHAGMLHAYVQILDSANTVVNTLTFRIYVQSDEGITSDTEAGDLYATFKQLMAQFEEMIQSSGLSIKGSYDTYEELVQAHPTGSLGDAYIVDDDLYLWVNNAWSNVGQFRGEDGATPEIGTNGNWYINGVDTGKPSRGVKGDAGEDGSDGQDGAAATITVGTVTTGAEGSQAQVTNSGTANAAIFDFVIPKGDTGDGGVPTDGEVGQVLTKTATGTEWQDAQAGLPSGGTTGQVLTKTADGHTWQDLPEIVEPTADELREILNTPVLEETNGKAVLKTPDASTTAILDIAGGGTGANNASDAANNLAVQSLANAISLSDNADLNLITTAGNYASKTDVQSKTILNTPRGSSSVAFSLTVEYSLGDNSSYYLRQTLKYRTYSTSFIRLSANNGTSWTNWSQLSTVSDLSNYLPLTGGTLSGSVTIGNGEESTYRDFQIKRKSAISNLRRNALFTTDGQSTVIGLLGEPEQGESQTGLNYLRLYPDRTEMSKALTISSGGTGANTARAAQHNLLSGMNSATDTPTDASNVVFAYDASTSNNGAIFKRPLSSLWAWIKSKADTIYAAVNHTHETDDITGLQTALNGKANSSHTHGMSDITGLPIEIIYTNSSQSLSGTTSKVLNIYKFCGIALVDVYVYVASFTKPSSYTEKTVLTLDLPSGIKLEPSGIEGYPSLRIWNDLCITANVTESATGTPQVNSAGTAIVFKGFFGGGGSTKAQAWRMLFTATLQ